MRLLHFRRTFVEKMFAIHSKVELFKRDRQPIGTYARHYYDLIQLAAEPEVTAMLRSAEYATIKADYDQVSRTHFEKHYFYPAEMSFANSDALFPSGELSAAIADGVRGANVACSVTGRTRPGPTCRPDCSNFENCCRPPRLDPAPAFVWRG